MGQEEENLRDLLSDDEYVAVIQKRFRQAKDFQADASQADEAWAAIAGKIAAEPLQKPAARRSRHWSTWAVAAAAACAGLWFFKAGPTAPIDQPVARDAGVTSVVDLELGWTSQDKPDTFTVRSESPGFAAFYLVSEDNPDPLPGLETVAVSKNTQTLHLPAALPVSGRICALTASTEAGLDKLKRSAEVLVPQLVDSNCLTSTAVPPP